VRITKHALSVPDRGPGLSISRSYNDLAPSNTLLGYGWTSELDEGLVVNGDNSVTFRDAGGGLHTFRPNGGGYLSPAGLFATLVKNGDGSFTISSHDQSKTNFNAAGYLTSIVDRNANALSIGYNGGLPTTETDAAGRTLTITTSGGHITAIAAPGSRNFAYGYDGNGNLTSYTDPAGIVTQYTYDASHRLTAITLNYQSGANPDQQTNVKTTLTYDSENRLVDLVDPLGFDVGITYAPPVVNGGGQLVGSQTTVQQLQTNPTTTPSSAQSLYETTTYDASLSGLGSIATMVDPMGGQTSYSYDASGDVTQIVDPDNRVTTSTYDGNGNELTRVVDPGSGGHINLTATYAYDSDNNVLTETDPAGIVTQYSYDAPGTGNLIKDVHNYIAGQGSTSTINVTTTYTYDQYGEVLTQTDPKGMVTKYVYDGQGDRTSTIQNYVSGGGSDSQTNVTTSATFDALGQQVTATDPLGVVSETVYDIRGGVMATIQNYISGGPTDDHTNVKTQNGFDALERQTSTTDPKGIVTETVYDADGRTIKSIQDYVAGQGSDSQTNVTSTAAYDAAGNGTLATDPKSNTTTTSFDADNRAYEAVQKGSDGTTISDQKTSYDPAGQVTSTQVIDGNTNPITSYTYDAAGRKATETDPPANPGASDATGQSNVTTYSYDADGNVLGTVVTNTKVSGNVSDEQASYDPLGHLTQKIDQAGTSAAQTTGYGYDANGQQTSTTTPDGKTTTDTLDALGRTVTVWHPDNTTEQATYDAASHELTSSGSNGTTTNSYDPLGRVSSEVQKDTSGNLISTTSYAYDPNGNMLNPITTDAQGHQNNVTYTYDKLGRIASISDGTHTYTYDANGNIGTMQVLNNGTPVYEADYAYDGGNRTTTLTDKVGTNLSQYEQDVATYDKQGNPTQVAVNGVATNYKYDAAGELLEVDDGTGTALAKYTYDANHNRLTQWTTAGTTKHVGKRKARQCYAAAGGLTGWGASSAQKRRA
jgi:YD repeat-containing protein